MSAGQALRDSGIARVSCGREDWISYALAVAVEVAEANVWGAVLRGDAFEPVGFCQATHPSAHARVVRIYKLKGAHHVE